jgi:hypothetical protein
MLWINRYRREGTVAAAAAKKFYVEDLRMATLGGELQIAVTAVDFP